MEARDGFAGAIDLIGGVGTLKYDGQVAGIEVARIRNGAGVVDYLDVVLVVAHVFSSQYSHVGGSIAGWSKNMWRVAALKRERWG